MAKNDEEETGGVTRGISAVEIKFTVRPDQELNAVRALDLDQDDAEQRRIYFIDSTALELYDQGLILRARAKDSDDDDTTVKVRPIEPDSIGKDWRSLPGFKVEADIVGDKVIRSASLSELQKQGEVPDAAQGKRPIGKLFSEDQERFARTHATATPDYAQLRLLGPVDVLRWKITDKKLPYEMTVEEWRLPNATDLLEISIKVAPEEEQKAVAAFQAYLRNLNLDLAGAQQTKTRIALEYFASQS
jgi:hypothetical protein